VCGRRGGCPAGATAVHAACAPARRRVSHLHRLLLRVALRLLMPMLRRTPALCRSRASRASGRAGPPQPRRRPRAAARSRIGVRSSIRQKRTGDHRLQNWRWHVPPSGRRGQTPQQADLFRVEIVWSAIRQQMGSASSATSAAPAAAEGRPAAARFGQHLRSSSRNRRARGTRGRRRDRRRTAPASGRSRRVAPPLDEADRQPARAGPPPAWQAQPTRRYSVKGGLAAAVAGDADPVAVGDHEVEVAENSSAARRLICMGIRRMDRSAFAQRGSGFRWCRDASGPADTEERGSAERRPGQA
jgi:hypothetical protein